MKSMDLSLDAYRELGNLIMLSNVIKRLQAELDYEIVMMSFITNGLRDQHQYSMGSLIEPLINLGEWGKRLKEINTEASRKRDGKPKKKGKL